jgi:hypothetical protein
MWSKRNLRACIRKKDLQSSEIDEEKVIVTHMPALVERISLPIVKLNCNK